MTTAVDLARTYRTTDVDRAIAYVATNLDLAYDVAGMLPAKVVADLWRAKLRADVASHVAATHDATQTAPDGPGSTQPPDEVTTHDNEKNVRPEPFDNAIPSVQAGIEALHARLLQAQADRQRARAEGDEDWAPLFNDDCRDLSRHIGTLQALVATLRGVR